LEYFVQISWTNLLKLFWSDLHVREISLIRKCFIVKDTFTAPRHLAK
jgi:hypothetical protein